MRPLLLGLLTWRATQAQVEAHGPFPSLSGHLRAQGHNLEQLVRTGGSREGAKRALGYDRRWRRAGVDPIWKRLRDFVRVPERAG